MKNEKPLLTVCIPTYNRLDNLKVSLKNILDSDKTNFSVLVSDNASTDGTWEYLKTIQDERLVISRNSENIGFSGNIFQLLKLSKTNFVIFISDEDFLSTSSLSELISSNELSADVGVIYPSVKLEDKKNLYYKYKDKKWRNKAAMNRFFLGHAYISGIIFNKSFIDFNKVENAILDENVVLYPHEIITYMILCNGGNLITKSMVIVRQGEAEESYLFNKYKYTDYNARLDLFKHYKRVVSKLNYNKTYSSVFYRKMSIIAAFVFVDLFFNKKSEIKPFVKGLFSIKLGFLFNLFFLMYVPAVFLKRKLKSAG